MSAEAEKVHGGHRQRVRDRAIADPALESMSDCEVLELMLFYALPRGDTAGIAAALLDRFGDLRGVLDAGMDRLSEVKGMGRESALFLSLFPAFTKRYLMSRAAADVSVPDAAALGRALMPCFIGKPLETLFALFLDGDRRTVACEELSAGNEKGVCLDTEKLCRIAVEKNAAYVVLAHNHPSGIAVPSAGDLRATAAAAGALAGIGVLLADHLIVADPLTGSETPFEAVSLADSGFFQSEKKFSG